MCASFEQHLGPAENQVLLAELGTTIGAHTTGVPEIIRPTDRAMVLSQTEVLTASFGFPLAHHRLVLNARSETIKDRPMFRHLLTRDRALVPMTGFYEFGHGGATPFTPTRSTVLCAAALLDATNQSFVLLTTEANQFVRTVHARMPLLLGPPFALQWLTTGVLSVEEVPLKGELTQARSRPRGRRGVQRSHLGQQRFE
jgi:putative SOS response-associated peptidase YedK